MNTNPQFECMVISADIPKKCKTNLGLFVLSMKIIKKIKKKGAHFSYSLSIKLPS